MNEKEQEAIALLLLKPSYDCGCGEGGVDLGTGRGSVVVANKHVHTDRLQAKPILISQYHRACSKLTPLKILLSLFYVHLYTSELLQPAISGSRIQCHIDKVLEGFLYTTLTTILYI